MNPIKKTARIAGILYFLQIPLGVFGLLYIPKTLIVADNITTTISNILANEFLFRLSIVSTLLCALITIATASYISKVLKPVNKNYSRWILLFTLIVAPISMLNELNSIAILLLAKGHQYTTNYTPSQLQSLVTLFLDLHHYGTQIIGIFFGLWLLPMGYLVFKSTYIPKVIGVFLLITCFGYLIDFITSFLYPNVGIYVTEYTWLGEVMMVLWLLIKGVNLEKYEKWNAALANA